ncbi:MAG: CopD family copper resistance protein [Alcaligenes sp.]|nr:hypothetical protein [Escherichia coli]
MTYLALLLAHLLAALFFIGTVFFEVLMLSPIARRVPQPAMRAVEQELGRRARRIVPWVLLVLYGAGLGLAWQHRALFEAGGGPAWLLGAKIVLALSVFGHFVTVMVLSRRGAMTGRRSRLIHRSVFVHVLLIVVLAKSLFYFPF